MPANDLTPQLRTRLLGVERAVAVFLLAAAALLLLGLAAYVRNTAQRKGWFMRKVPFYFYAKEATGLKPGDPVRFLGRDIGTIRVVDTTPPEPWFIENNYNVFVQADIWEPYYGYIWSDSQVRILPGDFFGKRVVEITRGQTGQVTVVETPDFADMRILNDKKPDDYLPLRESKSGVWLQAQESEPFTDKLDSIVATVRQALPGLTNQLAHALGQATLAASNAALVLADARPAVTNLTRLTAQLNDGPGAVGRLLLPPEVLGGLTNMLAGTDATLTNAAALTAAARGELTNLTTRLALSLDQLASLTSNLNAQVGANSLILSEISSLVVNSDDLVQGLKRNWLLRGAYPAATNMPLESVLPPMHERPR
ncbi:MAG: MlaD family protein [Limisphaerales bacterium]